MNYQIYIQKLNEWLFLKGVKVVVILIVAWLAIKIVKTVISKLLKAFIEKTGTAGTESLAQKQRITTLTKVFNSGLKVVIWTIAVLTILPELGINITALLAGAGLVGLAIGMGARSLVQDYLAGLFILFEDQYRVGEEVDIDGLKGRVRDLNLRRTVLRDDEGTFRYISNGRIKIVSNFSRK